MKTVAWVVLAVLHVFLGVVRMIFVFLGDSSGGEQQEYDAWNPTGSPSVEADVRDGRIPEFKDLRI